MGSVIYAVIAVSAVVPSLLLMGYFHRRDLYREPARDLWLAFGVGILVALPVLAFAAPLEPAIEVIDSPLAYGLASAFLQAAIPEELFKFLMLWFVAARRAAFDEPMDGVVYGVALSLGFATLENVLYVAGGGLEVAVTRAITAVPAHAFLGAIMGYFVGRAKFEAFERRRLLAWAVGAPIVLHGLYDWPLLSAARAGSGAEGSHPLLIALLSIAPLVVVAEWIWAVRLSRRLRVAQLESGLPELRGRRASRGERWSSLALTVGGGIVASLGGLTTLAIGFVLLPGGEGVESTAQLVAGGIFAGVTPTLIGAALFFWGVRRLNESGASLGPDAREG